MHLKTRQSTQLGVSDSGFHSLARRDFLQKSSVAAAASLLVTSIGVPSSSAAGDDDELIDVYFGCGMKTHCLRAN